MEKSPWIRNPERCKFACATFAEADNHRKLVRPLDSARAGEQPDESTRKVRVKARANGTYDVIVWDRTPEQKPKRERKPRSKRES